MRTSSSTFHSDFNFTDPLLMKEWKMSEFHNAFQATCFGFSVEKTSKVHLSLSLSDDVVVSRELACLFLVRQEEMDKEKKRKEEEEKKRKVDEDEKKQLV